MIVFELNLFPHEPHSDYESETFELGLWTGSLNCGHNCNMMQTEEKDLGYKPCKKKGISKWLAQDTKIELVYFQPVLYKVK